MTTKPTFDTAMHPQKHPVPFEDPLRLFSVGLTKLYSKWVSLTYPFASIGHDLTVQFPCHLLRSKANWIKLGNAVMIMKDAALDVIASPEQNGEPIIVVDDGAQIGFRCLLSAKNGIHIERDVIMAQSVLITDHGYAHEDGTSPVREQNAPVGGRICIGQGSWIGQGAAIVCTRGELVLGSNCVVGANAVVTRSFPSNSVIFGNPARVIKQFDPAKNAWVLGGIQSEIAERTK